MLSFIYIHAKIVRKNKRHHKVSIIVRFLIPNLSLSCQAIL